MNKILNSIFNHLFTCCVSFFLLTSCQKALDVDIDCEPQMVVASILVPGRPVEVKLTSSIPVRAKKKATPIEGATVSLYEGSALLGTLTYSPDSIYTLDTPVTQGKTYTLRATCNGYPSIEAITTVPTAQNFSVSREVYADDGQTYDYNTFTTYYFPASQSTSYYAIFKFYSEEIFNGIDTYTNFIVSDIKVNQYVEFIDRSNYWWSSKHRMIDFTDIRVTLELYTYSLNDREVWGGSCIFLSNAPFAGKEFSIKNNDYRYSEDYDAYVNIYLMSPELYKSLRGFAAQNSTSNSLVVTPVPAYNSVIGGLGYFGSAVEHTLNLTENTTIIYRK